MQKKELERQVTRVNEVKSDLSTKLGGAVKQQVERIGRVSQSQLAQQVRMDTILQLMMDWFQPNLSDEERKWFDKLYKMRAVVKSWAVGVDKVCYFSKGE